MKNNKKKILIYSILGVVTLLIVTLTITYAYWILTRQQTGENVVNTACLNISFTGENDITLDKAYPMNPEQLENFLSTETPYHFTIHNECNELASASINLESLTVSGKALEDEYIDAILYEDDYNTNLNTNKQLTTPNDENKVIIDAKHAYSLYSFNLKPDETRDFNLLLYMDPQTPMEEDNMNASWKGKITLSTGYKVDSKAIRQISYNDSNGMWDYKDKLTKIVIEDKKSVKEAPEGGKVYGPFDESEYGTKAVESYVVCEADDANCVGYLQSDGKVIANHDSSNLFYNFSSVAKIEGLEKLDTKNVENMGSMFNGMAKLETIDLHSFDTSNVTTMYNMFTRTVLLKTLDLSSFKTDKLTNIMGLVMECDSLQELNLSNWKFNNSIAFAFTSTSCISKCSQLEKLILDNVDTSEVTNMQKMFMDLKNITTLDLSYFDTSHVTNMSELFNSSNNLQSLDLSSWDTSNVKNINSMFTSAKNLQTLNLSNWKFNDDMANAFCLKTQLNLISLNSLILDNVDTSEVTNMTAMFNSCASLTSLDLSSFDTSNVTRFEAMFQGASNLQSITFGPKFVHNPEATTRSMFGGCPAPERPTGDTWNGVSFD